MGWDVVSKLLTGTLSTPTSTRQMCNARSGSTIKTVLNAAFDTDLYKCEPTGSNWDQEQVMVGHNNGEHSKKQSCGKCGP